ncbi:maltokinase N-terminal cap-like domain-containing protein [Cellulomonas citrea]|uniref:maltokinase N-terminal cap-like domain-containing protein n=1 Tax=Cellulomonas citrea TaxID=1909423 RepID=UPI00135B4CDC|nr:phosphotransferase [Cellulomonas citrea]
MTVTVGRADGLDARLLDVLRPWLADRRWFPVKDGSAQVTLIGSVQLASGLSLVRVLLLRVRGDALSTVLQVPVVLTPDAAGADEVIGSLDGRHVLDGAGHPAFLAAWLAAADGPPRATSTRAALLPSSGRVLTGEQSNTSVVLSAGGASAAILKVLRAPAGGENPDVDVPRHLVEVGWDAVPAPLGWLTATWPGADDEPTTGYLGALSAFVPEAADGFVLACDHARAGTSFAPLAAELGTVVASMHAALVRAYGSFPDADLGPGAVADGLAARYAWAVQSVPELTRHRDGVAAVLAALRALPAAPPRQRVHGDLHLGQVLRSSGRWYVTDFEGEPLAPLAERTRPDLAVRDVAGVLRSLDYAAAVGGRDRKTAGSWLQEARTAFLEAYEAAAPGCGDQHLLLRAQELDKTLYEAVYEARHRPDWLPIPLAGLDRLLRP